MISKKAINIKEKVTKSKCTIAIPLVFGFRNDAASCCTEHRSINIFYKDLPQGIAVHVDTVRRVDIFQGGGLMVKLHTLCYIDKGYFFKGHWMVDVSTFRVIVENDIFLVIARDEIRKCGSVVYHVPTNGRVRHWVVPGHKWPW